MATEPAAPLGTDAGADAPAPLPIETLTIENLRGIRHVRLTGLGRVNLLTGRNNIGKSTVIEALRLLRSEYVPYTIGEILHGREEDRITSNSANRSGTEEAARSLSTLFFGFPVALESWLPITLRTSSQPGTQSVSINLAWAVRDESGPMRRLVRPQPGLFDDLDTDLFGNPDIAADAGLVLALEITIQDKAVLLPLTSPLRSEWRRRSFRPGDRPAAEAPCIWLSPDGARGTDELAVLWDQIALSDLETSVIDALRIIEPRIQAATMIGTDIPERQRTAIVRAAGVARPLPLRSFGDGINRLFAMALSLVNAKGGLLLIDEFENGLHYSVQVDAWRMIFRLAAELDIQVFATTHSWDAIEAFQQAAAESPEQGALIRLARRGEDLIATTFTEDDLAVVTREHIEVR